MNDFKKQLDNMMGNTEQQEQRIKNRVYQRLRKSPKKHSWKITLISTAAIALSFALFSNIELSTDKLQQVTSEEGQITTPYNPAPDITKISNLHMEGQLSAIDYEELATLPLLKSLSRLQYIDSGKFTLNNDAATYHVVVERQKDLYSSVVYQPGDMVKTFNDGALLYHDVFYEVIAVPGDRVTLQNGKLLVNGKALDTPLLKQYEQNQNTLLGSLDQVLQAKEYYLLNHFPTKQTPQAGTITSASKIFGEVVALARENYTDTIFFQQDEILYNSDNAQLSDYGPEAYFDLYLYDASFGSSNISQFLTLEGSIFPHINRERELLLEAAYREVNYISENEVEIHYKYGLPGVTDYTFNMHKLPNSTIWKWGNKFEE